MDWPASFLMYNPASMNPPSFELVIFDCDGVLVDSEPLANRIIVEMMGEYGYQVNEAEFLREFSGTTLPYREKTIAQKLDWNPPQNFLAELSHRLETRAAKELQPIPHVRELIESLNVPVCVASNGNREEIGLRLQVAGLTEIVGNRIFSATEVPHPKPAPDVYLAAAKAFGVAPSQCVVVEDSVPGVTAGIRAGMRVYGHAALTDERSLREAGAIPFFSMPQLKVILAREYSPVQ